MSWNTSLLAFDDAREALDRAVASDKGIKINCASHGLAVSLRSRFNYYRKQDRAANRKTYGPEHPKHNTSVYDTLVLRIPHKTESDANVLYIEKRSANDFNIEDIK